MFFVLMLLSGFVYSTVSLASPAIPDLVGTFSCENGCSTQNNNLILAARGRYVYDVKTKWDSVPSSGSVTVTINGIKENSGLSREASGSMKAMILIAGPLVVLSRKDRVDYTLEFNGKTKVRSCSHVSGFMWCAREIAENAFDLVAYELKKN
jgi:hypothetical protein